MHPQFLSNVSKIEFTISLFYQLRLPPRFLAFLFIVLQLYKLTFKITSNALFLLTLKSPILTHVFTAIVFPIHPFSPVLWQLSDHSFIFWFTHPLFIQSYSLPYSLVSTGLDVLGGSEMDQVRDLSVLDYLPPRPLKILNYSFPTNCKFSLVSDFNSFNKNLSFSTLIIYS